MRWVHLRLCQECGHVGCCDQSQGKHATKHFHATRHPIMRSFERGEDWSWCYVDEVFFEPALSRREDGEDGSEIMLTKRQADGRTGRSRSRRSDWAAWG